MKKNKKRTTIMILAIIFTIVLTIIGITYYKSQTKDIDSKKESKNIKEYKLSMKDKTGVYPYQEKYFDIQNSFKIVISDIVIDDKNYELTYKKSYEDKKISLYLNKEELLVEDINAFTLQAIHIVEDYIFITNGWNDKYSTLFLNSNGDIIKKINGLYSYNDGIITVFKSSEQENNKHIIESYKFNLKGDLSNYDNIQEEINCEDYLNGTELKEKELEKFVYNYCSKESIKNLMK